MTQCADPGVLDALASMAPSVLDELPFGVIAMHVDGTVTDYNLREAAFSGLTPSRVIGRNFFTEVAPCTNNFIVADRMRDEVEIDATVDYIFSVRLKPTPVTLRLLRSASRTRMFLLVNWTAPS